APTRGLPAWRNPPSPQAGLPPIQFIVLVRVLVIVIDRVISSTSITITRTSTASLSTISELPGKGPKALKAPCPSRPVVHPGAPERELAAANRRQHVRALGEHSNVGAGAVALQSALKGRFDADGRRHQEAADRLRR